MTNSILRSLSVLLFLTVFATPALAAPPGGNNPAIQDLMDEIDKLETRVGDLETTIGQAKDAITALEASLASPFAPCVTGSRNWNWNLAVLPQ